MTQPSKAIPLCTECGERVQDASADVWWDTDAQTWRVIEVHQIAWCSSCEESHDWHWADLHPIEDEPHDFTK